jgi:membrane fusion protein, multidrug efflux system
MLTRETTKKLMALLRLRRYKSFTPPGSPRQSVRVPGHWDLVVPNQHVELLRRAALAALICGLALTGCGRSHPPQNQAPEVGVVVIKPQSVPLTTELPGRTDPYLTSNVVPQVTGILQSILFKQGGLVRAGQPLFQIDPRPFQAAYDQAKGQLARDRATLANAKVDLARYQSLWKQNAISQQTLQTQVATVASDTGTVEADEAAVEMARINLGWTRITAPIAGQIGRVLITPGALVTANQTTPLAVIQTLDPIYVDVNQSSAELVQLEQAAAAGQMTRRTPATALVTLQLEDGTRYPHDGVLQFSEVTVDPTTGAVVLRCKFPNPNGLLLPGMYVRATIVEGIVHNVILAPQRGVGRNEKGEPTALVVDGHGIARLHILTAPRVVGDSWLVTAGLSPGDKLIVEGLQNAQPDHPVHAVAAGSPPPAASSMQ